MLLFLAFLLLAAAILVLAMALGRREVSGVDRSLAAIESLTSRHAAEAAATERPFGERVVEPLQARALILGRRLSGADSTERIRRKLDLAGNPRDWSVDRVLSLKVMATVAGVVAGAALGFLLELGLGALVAAALVGAAVGFFSPDLYLYQRTYDRSEAIRRTLADAVDLLTISVEAGLGFDAALQQVARNTGGPLAEEFSRVLREMQIGQGRGEALRALSARTNVDDLQIFVGAMVQADSFGIPIGQVLRTQSSEMRIKRRQYAEKKAQQVPVKITIPLIICVLPCLMVVVMGPAIIRGMQQFG